MRKYKHLPSEGRASYSLTIIKYDNKFHIRIKGLPFYQSLFSDEKEFQRYWQRNQIKLC